MTSSNPNLSSAPPLTSYRSKYMRSDASAMSNSSSGNSLRDDHDRDRSSSTRSIRSTGTQKIRPGRRLRRSSVSSSTSANSQTSFEDRSAKKSDSPKNLSSSRPLVSRSRSSNTRTRRPASTTKRFEPPSSNSAASAHSNATDASSDTTLTRNTKSSNDRIPSHYNRSTARKNTKTSPLESLPQQREHNETSSRLDDMRRKLDSTCACRPRAKVLKSLSDGPACSKSTPSTSANDIRHQSKDEDTGIRLSEFTSITTSLSDAEEDVDDLMFDRQASANIQTRGGEEDTLGTILHKIVGHVKVASSRSSRKLSTSPDDLADATTEHRSNYSKRRLSITARRASDFLFSSHHRDDDDEEDSEDL